MFSDSIVVHTFSETLLPIECETLALIRRLSTAKSRRYWPPAPIDFLVTRAFTPPLISVGETLIPSALTPKVSAADAFEPKSIRILGSKFVALG